MMSALLSTLILGAAVISSASAKIFTGQSFTSMYYDCCKPACAWPTYGSFVTGLKTCDKNDQPVLDDTAGGYCGNGGPASTCTNQRPWAVNDTFSYGYASVFIRGLDATEWCCACYELEFIDSDIKGKKMIVQSVNVNFNENQINWFSLTVPGQADWQGECQRRFGGTFGEFFGVNATGFKNVTQCDTIPASLQDACRWRYTWYQDVKGPNATFKRVECPAELTSVSGCLRTDDKTFNSSASAAVPALSLLSPISPFTTLLALTAVFVGFPQILDLF